MPIEPNTDEYIHDFLVAKSKALEQQIQQKGELLDFFMTIQKSNDTPVVTDQIAMLTTDLQLLIDDLIKLRQDSEYIDPLTQGVIDKMGNIKTISHEKLIESLRGKYLWQQD